MEPSISHVKKNDTVQVLSGKDRGKTGKILRVIQKHGRVVVEKVNMVKRHTRPTGKQPGGILEKEGTVAGSNVLLYCEKCGKGVRTGRKVLESGNKIRICRKCNSPLDK